MKYVHKYLERLAEETGKSKSDIQILDIGAATGGYSIPLWKEGYDVTAVELVKHNLGMLKAKGTGVKAFQGNALKLKKFEKDFFDLTLLFGPMYHLYEDADVQKAIDEAIRVTKPGGTILFAFISVFAIMYSNYFQGNWRFGEEENFTPDYKVKHFKEQLFTGYDVVDFEKLFE